MGEALAHWTGLVKVSTSYENGVSQRPSPGQKQGPPRFLSLNKSRFLPFSHQSRADFPSLSPYKFNTEILCIDWEGLQSEPGHLYSREMVSAPEKYLHRDRQAVSTPDPSARSLLHCETAPAWEGYERGTPSTPVGCNYTAFSTPTQ